MRTILITGATGKIGQVLVKYFLAAGEIVIATARSSQSLEKLEAEVVGSSGKLYTLCVDLLDSNSFELILRFFEFNGFAPDCLINNARNSQYLRVDSVGCVLRDDFVNEFVLDVIVPYELTMALSNAANCRLRSVVNVGSQYGIVVPNLALYSDPVRQSPLHYGVAKAALSHLTKELAVRLASVDIRVNCVAYGGVEGRVDYEFEQRYAALCPSGRMLKEDELAAPVDLLLSIASSAITGHVLVVDCGWSLW